MTDLNLPDPIAAYFDADHGDGEAVARCFTKQAVVKDEGQTHCGAEAIKAWKTGVSAKYSQHTLRHGAEGRPVHRHEPVDRQLSGKPD